MFRYNYDFAYVTETNGVIILKLQGNIHDRRDNVSVVIDNQNNCTISFINNHYSKNNYFKSWGTVYSDYDIDEVLPEYVVEEGEKSESRTWYGKKIITVTNFRHVISGIVRLNKQPVVKTIRANNWYIEFNDGQVRQSNINNVI